MKDPLKVKRVDKCRLSSNGTEEGEGVVRKRFDTGNTDSRRKERVFYTHSAGDNPHNIVCHSSTEADHRHWERQNRQWDATCECLKPSGQRTEGNETENDHNVNLSAGGPSVGGESLRGRSVEHRADQCRVREDPSQKDVGADPSVLTKSCFSFS